LPLFLISLPLTIGIYIDIMGGDKGGNAKLKATIAGKK
jgi:hypothetical protein